MSSLAEKITEAQVQHTAREIKKAYMAKKREIVGAMFKPNPKIELQDDFVKAARVCVQLQASPEDYVEAAFEAYGTSHKGGMFPRFLHGPKASQKIATELHNLKQVRGAAKSLIEQAHDGGGRAVAEMIDNTPETHLEFGAAWVHYCLQAAMALRVENPSSAQLVSFAETCGSHVHPAIRYLYGWQMEYVLEMVGHQGYTFLLSHPAWIDASEAAGFQTRAILQHTHQRIAAIKAQQDFELNGTRAS